MDDVQLTLRIRRDKTTFFISSAPYESIDLLKRKILIFHKGLEVGDLRLYHSGKVQMIENLGITLFSQLLD
jgi:hypothetical protein